jgi:hypothetical protein
VILHGSSFIVMQTGASLAFEHTVRGTL